MCSRRSRPTPAGELALVGRFKRLIGLVCFGLIGWLVGLLVGLFQWLMSRAVGWGGPSILNHIIQQPVGEPALLMVHW